MELTLEVSEELRKLEEMFSEDNKAKTLEESLQKFNDLVEKGIIKRRGYNLLSISDAHMKRNVSFNNK